MALARLAAIVLLLLASPASASSPLTKAWGEADDQGDQAPWPSNYDLVMLSYWNNATHLAINVDLAGSPMEGRASYFVGFQAENTAYSVTCWFGPENPLEPEMRNWCTGSSDEIGSACVQSCQTGFVEPATVLANGSTGVTVLFPLVNLGSLGEQALAVMPRYARVSVTLAVEQPTYSETTLATTDEHDTTNVGFNLEYATPNVTADEDAQTAPTGGRKEAGALPIYLLAFGLLVGLVLRRP